MFCQIWNLTTTASMLVEISQLVTTHAFCGLPMFCVPLICFVLVSHSHVDAEFD